MTLKTAALVAALAQTGSLIMTVVTTAIHLPAYSDPLLLLSMGVHVVAQAAAATFFALYYYLGETSADAGDAIPVYRLGGDEEPEA